MTELEELIETLDNLGVAHYIRNLGMQGIVLKIDSSNSVPGTSIPVVFDTSYETHCGFVFRQNGELEKVVLG